MGLSMGGVLTLMAAARYPVQGAVAISAPYDLPPDPRIKFIKVLSLVYPRAPKGPSDFHNKDAEKDHVDYPYTPTRAVLPIQELLKVMKTDLPNIKVPVMLVQSHGDHTIPEYSLDRIFAEVGSSQKEKLWVEDSGHVVVREPERERVFKAVVEFIKKTSQPA